MRRRILSGNFKTGTDSRLSYLRMGQSKVAIDDDDVDEVDIDVDVDDVDVDVYGCVAIL